MFSDKRTSLMDWSSPSPEPGQGPTESAVEEDSSNITSHISEVCSEETENAPLLQLHTLKEFEKHLNDLKKENFSLKLRIYFLEERIQQKYEESSEDVYRSNIELKVEVESLKQELLEKQQLLDKALKTAENLTNHNEAELQRRCQERHQEIDQMQQVLETKIQLLQEEAQLARSEAERMASLAGSQSQASLMSLDTPMDDIPEEDRSIDIWPSSNTSRDRLIEELTKELQSKDTLITELTSEKNDLQCQVGELEGQVQELSSSLLQKDKDVDFYQEELGRERLRIEEEMQSLVEEQQSQLNQYECAAGQCVSELQKAQLQVQSLQAKFNESEAKNLKLQEKLNEMECELRSLRQSSQSQERTIQGLNDCITTKDNEAQELYQMLEGQNATLCKFREMVQRNQLSQSKAPEGGTESLAVAQLQDELVSVQSSLFSLGLEMEASQRSLKQSQRREADLLKFKGRLDSDLQEAVQHREVTEKHNQTLHCTLQKTRSELQTKEAALKETEAEKHRLVQEKERAIARLKQILGDKERKLQEFSEMLESLESCKQRDVLVEKLRERIKERDKALEYSIDEKFHCLEEHEGQVRSLQVALREKERDLERLRCILSNNEDTITSLDSLVRSKDLELEQAAEAYRNLQCLKQRNEEKDRTALRERDAIISQLQAALQTHSQEAQDLTAALVATRVQTTCNELIEELKARLSLKEKLFQELLSDRSRQSNEHLAQIQDLLNILSAKDQYLQDYSYRMSLVISERTSQLHEIQKQLSLRELELCKLKQDKDLGGDAENLKSLLKEKESLIKELIQSQEEALESSTKETEAKISGLQEELHLVLKKEREAREELSALQTSLGHQQTAQQGSASKYSEYQCMLDQLLSEYNSLNDALRTEKSLYQRLSQIHNRTDSVDKIQALHTELDSVQALRGQLEEVLARTRDMALMLQRASKRPADLGDLRSMKEKDFDDFSSEEFSDSIEEEDCKMTTHSFTSIQASEIQQLEEERTTLEAELEEIQSQLEKDGFSSFAHMRSTLRKLEKENCALKESQNQTNVEQCLSDQETEYELETEEEEEEDEDKESDEEEESPLFSDQHQTRPNTLKLSSHNVGGGLPVCSKTTDCFKEGLREQASRLRLDLAMSCQENRELQERLMVSEATVQAQAEQLKDYRDLLTETSVKQASKHVQVDLQDLGYETCGRSENEAEREDASSPEFDDLEMCTALSQHQDYEGEARGWYVGNPGHTEPFKMRADPCSLQHLVQDLRSQLSHCHKVIRGLQMRVRSLSATSDYASSLERTPRKVNWALAKSPAPSGVEEDEGWMSDPQGTHSGSTRNKALQELMERVASLENQLRNSKKDCKGQSDDAKCATWPGKYNSLIQAQARELSHLRQRIREGQGVCHILSQHLGDTTKTFEELLRSNDIDYYMGQSFREQLGQSTALAQRVVAKISGRDCTESCDDKTATHLALKLSKELQQKDKIIESLHSKLQQRAGTPSSCHALSETTDQSDRTSMVSDEFRGTEDLDLGSEADRQEYPEEHSLQSGRFGSEQNVFLPYSHRPLKSSSSCPNMLCSAHFAGAPLPQLSFPSPYGSDVSGKELAPSPQPRALSVNAVWPEVDFLFQQNSGSFLSGDHNQLNLTNHSQLSHHAFQQYQLRMPEDYSLKSDSGLVTTRTLWDMGSKASQTQSYSGLTEHPDNSIAGMHLIEEHLQEVKCLRQRLEESIRTNERLRQQLEERLASTGREGGAPTNIYIQGLDTVTQLSNEIRVLKEENLGLQSRLQASTGEEVGQLRDAVFTARARLKQAELEAEQWKEELRRLQIHSEEQSQQLNALRQERQMSQEQTNRLQHDVSLLQQQLCESRDLIHSLQGELQVYDQMCARTRTSKSFLSELPILPVELAELLGEVRSLRAQLQNSIQENSTLKQLELHKQLEQKLSSPRTLRALTASPQRESFYKRQLLHDPAPSPPVRDIGLFNCETPGPPYPDLEDCHSTANDTFDPHAELEGEAPDGSFANRNGRHVIGHVDDFSALQQQILEGCNLVHQINSTLQSCQASSLIDDQTYGHKNVLNDSSIAVLFANTKTLRQIFEEVLSLLKMFWRAALPNTDVSVQSLKKEQCLQEEILSLKLRVSEQEEVLKGTIQRLRSTSRTKESMEHFIVSQLSRTRDVLKKARTNLEKNELRLSSLSSSSSPYTGEEPGESAREWSSDYCVMTSHGAANQRLATRKRTSQCLL